MINEKQKIKQEVSKIDGNPIVNINAADLPESTQLSHLRDKLAANHGSAIVSALNEKARLNTIQQGRSVSMKNLTQFSRSKGDTPDLGSSHIRVTDPDGETEDFVLTLRRYHSDPQKIAAKGSSSKLKSGTTYMALSPDRFYLQDDENGNEKWPVTFPAVAMDDSTDKITVTFNKDGFVSSSLTENAKAKGSSAQPNLVFAEGTPVIAPNYVAPCPDCGGGGGGGSGGGGSGPYCTEVSGRGEEPGEAIGYPNPANNTFFSVNSVRLWATGDGDGAAELQMFIKNDDNYDGECFPRSYKYRFDRVVRDNPINWLPIPQNNTIIQGADQYYLEDYYYDVPDIDSDGITYHFNNDRWQKTLDPFAQSEWMNVNNDHFPLFNLDNRPGPWRLVMSDDDKDYQDFSRRRQSDFAQDIQTYDMASGTWSEVKTGFSTDRKTTGSSDDPIRESGVRKITKANATQRMSNDYVIATKYYSGGSFRYEFSFRDN